MELTAFGGDGVVLNQLTDADIPRIVEYCQDKDIGRWTVVPIPYTEADARTFLDEIVEPGWVNGTEYTWAIRLDDDPLLRGTVGLRMSGTSAEIGFLVAPDSRGAALCARACRPVLAHALSADGLALDRVVWKAVVGNWASRRVAWHLGFRVEGTMRAEITLRQKRYDAWVGTLLAGDPLTPNEPWPREAPARP